MECFNTLLLKLREVHEREVEGWQVKIQELSNKKGCDTKRMEELFTKNQQMKEQQRLLTENIKTLENRLRAGLCDRCTVTQEVAKRRQQEYEASHIQSIQHISVLAGEMNNLKTENKRLRDEIKSLKATFNRGHSDRSSNGSTTTEVKSNSSPELSNSSGPVALVTPATSRANKQPAGGDVAVKTEQRAEAGEHRPWRGATKCHYDSYKPLSPSALTLSSWKGDRVGERAQSIERLERLEHQSSIPPHALLIKNCSLSSSGVNPSRHVLHTPVPCRPQPIKSSPLQWPLTESSDWVSAAPGTSLVVQPSNKANLPRFPNLIPIGQHSGSRRQGSGLVLPKECPSKPKATEPTVLFRLKNMTECLSSSPKPQEKKETPPPKPENVSGEVLKEMCEGPLDLSDRGKSKSSGSPGDCSPTALQAVEIVENSPDEEVKTIPSTKPAASPHPVTPPTSSSPPPSTQREEESTSDDNEKRENKEQKQKEEVKKVPVLTISLRPVVVLETLKSAQQKHDLLNEKSSSPAIEMESSSDEQGEEGSVSGQESTQSCKRKRASVETETDRDSDTDNIHQERKIKVTVKPEENSPS